MTFLPTNMDENILICDESGKKKTIQLTIADINFYALATLHSI